MTESVARRGRDAFVSSVKPNIEYGGARYLQLKTGEKRALVYVPMPADIVGKTVASATLTAHVRGAWSAQTLNVTPLAADWSDARVNWNNQPTTRTGTASVTTGALSDGDEVAIDVKVLVQQVADGQKHYGWRVGTFATTEQRLYAFDSGRPAWTLTVVTSEAPEAPSVLVPNGSVVGVGSPTMTFDYTDLSALRVQIDPAADEVTPDFDSGWLTTTTPVFDPDAHGYTPISVSATSQWRVAVRKTGSSVDSEWSDWAPFTYQPLPVLTLDSPAAGVLYDPTSDVLAHIGGTNLDAYRVRITSGTDRTNVLYDSGKVPASSASAIAHALPEKNADKSRIFVDDRNYQLNVRAFDDYVREDTADSKTYAELWATIHFDDDLARTPVTSLYAAQVGETPSVRLSWTRAAAADAWVVVRDGAVVARLDPADTVIGASTYSWTDPHPEPNLQHVYRIHALVDGTRSAASPTATITTLVLGMWLLRDNGDAVCVDGDGVGGFRTLERRASYKPLRVPYDVDIITGFEGLSGAFEGSVEERTDQALEDAIAVLDAIKNAPSEPVQMVYAEVSVPVLVRQLTCLPDPAWTLTRRRHSVSFDVFQVGDFKHGVN